MYISRILSEYLYIHTCTRIYTHTYTYPKISYHTRTDTCLHSSILTPTHVPDQISESYPILVVQSLLDTLHSARPNMTLLAADFNFLPEVQEEGHRAPIIASKEGGVQKDHSTYLVTKASNQLFSILYVIFPIQGGKDIS